MGTNIHRVLWFGWVLLIRKLVVTTPMGTNIHGVIVIDGYLYTVYCTLKAVINSRRACAVRVTVVGGVVCVCVFVCPIEILRMAALSIELSHVLCIKSNYLQNGCVVCRKTFVPEIQPKLQLKALRAAWPRL